MHEVPTIEQMNRRATVSGLISLLSKLHSRPELCDDAEIVVHFKPETDLDLRGILMSFDEYWDFEPVDAILTRSFGMSGGKVRADIDVSMLGLADVLTILDETRPAW